MTQCINQLKTLSIDQSINQLTNELFKQTNKPCIHFKICIGRQHPFVLSE